MARSPSGRRGNLNRQNSDTWSNKTMILTGHQPNYLPYLGFFHKVYHSDLFVIVDNVQYVKRGPFGWVSRNRIKTATGPQWLSVPVLVKGKFEQKIMETLINPELPWGRKHWKSLLVNYGKTPYFYKYADFFEEMYMKRSWENFCDLSCHFILYLLKSFGIDRPVKKASEIGASGKGDELILDMCEKTGADQYLHGKHGKDYADETKFSARKIRSLYQEFDHPVYHQQFGEFVPNLSAIDLLFNYGGESLDILLGRKKVNL
ncbi:MAG: hypothetical protein EXS63_03225 [Candidatus Omnitrophica bacterium]|nr:hypothetical protein [Candidatus Omnitrophota bacterium]